MGVSCCVVAIGLAPTPTLNLGMLVERPPDGTKEHRDWRMPQMSLIETALTRLLGIEHPILLAPMGSAAGGKLAAAVTNTGGLGLVGSGYADAKIVRKELAEAGNARVGIGFILWALEKNPQALDVALDAKPAAVMLSFGDPTPFMSQNQECRL
jgi:NAD(P)H-dependent flavin oxidoreductase YrpB (nitropropane dioxygenase family)